MIDGRRLATTLRRSLLRPLVLVPLVLVLGGGAWAVRARSTPSTTVGAGPVQRTVAVTSGTMRQTVTVAGTLAPANTQDLSFTTSGKVTVVNVKVGQQVAQGAVLATIDSAALQSQVAQARATVASAAARLSSDQAAAASSAQLASDRATLAAAQAQLAGAQAQLSGATLTAPIAGTVSALNLTVGQQLGGSGASGTSVAGGESGTASDGAAPASPAAGGGSGSPQIQLISAGSFVANLSVDDTQIARIAVGQPATVRLSSAPPAADNFSRFGAPAAPTTTAPAAAASADQAVAPAQGTVASIGIVASSTSGVASFPVVVSIAGSPSGFFAGSTVQVAITYNQLDNVLQVPSLAVSRANGQSTVTVTSNGKRTQRTVTTGLVSEGRTQITNGLNRGELVVITIPVQQGGPTNPGSNRGGGDEEGPFGGGGDEGPFGGGGGGGHPGGGG